eukprot:m.231980 g.231980  ORF g.231980 m.231980 type:complete len:169 (-) comp17072_c0_seq1:167-673(-)
MLKSRLIVLFFFYVCSNMYVAEEIDSLAPNFTAYQDLNSSFSKLYSSLIDNASAPPQQPMLTFQTVEDVMSNLQSNPLLLQSLDQSVFQRTQELMRSVRGDLGTSGNWLLSPNFPDLAQSFNTLMQSSANPFTGMDLGSFTSTAPTLEADIFNVDDEEEFDWDKLPLA